MVYGNADTKIAEIVAELAKKGISPGKAAVKVEEKATDEKEVEDTEDLTEYLANCSH